MADSKEIKIVLETVNGSSSGMDSGDTERVDAQVSAQATSESSGKSQGKAAYGAMAIQAANFAVNEVMNWISYNINKELNLNDDYIGQRNLAIATQAVNWAVSSASTIGSMAMVGAAAGPIGAAVGAVVGGAMVAASTVRQNMQAMDQQNIMLNQMQAQLDFTRNRAGWSTKAASIGEDL